MFKEARQSEDGTWTIVVHAGKTLLSTRCANVVMSDELYTALGQYLDFVRPMHVRPDSERWLLYTYTGRDMDAKSFHRYVSMAWQSYREEESEQYDGHHIDMV